MKYIIHEMLVLLKNYLNYLRVEIDFYFKKRELLFFKICSDGNFKSSRRKHN